MASKLKYPIEDYQPQWYLLEEAFPSEKAMREEYSRLRDIAQKRLKRLGTKGFERSETYKYFKERFPVLAEFSEKRKIKNKAEFAEKFAQLARFIESPISTVSGQRQVESETISSLNKLGYTFLNESNYWDFMEFMNEYRARKLDKTYDSDRVVKLYKAADRKGVDTKKLFDDFDKYMKNKRALKDLAAPKDKKKLNSAELAEAIGGGE